MKRRLEKRNGVHTHNGILVTHKNNEILPFAARWMNLEDIILSGISQKDKYSMISLTYEI